jgi:hypothetical protein
MPGITFVTAYFPYVDTPHFNKCNDHKCNDLGDIDPTHDLLKTGVQICMYIPLDCSYRDVFDQWAIDYAHFKIMPLRIPKTYQQTSLFSLLNQTSCLPSCRNSEKDTIEHLLWLHYRMELLRDATRTNPFGSDEFVWVDANITSLFHRKTETLGRIGKIQKQLASVYSNSGAYSKNSVFLPGCTAKPSSTAKPLESATSSNALENPYTKIEPNMDQISWRFCGAFLAGKWEAISAFCDEYLSELEHSVQKTGRITWDVNWLAYLESLKESTDWTPVWYHADHNDSIIEILHGLPITTYSLKELIQLEDQMGVRQTEYDLPIVDGYHPGSTSFVRWNDKAILNTRYINYSLANEGKNYVFATSEFIIKNKNYASTVDPVTADLVGVQEMNDTDLFGVDGTILKRPRGDHTRYISYGLEDIRLFVGEQNALKFIATTVDYSPVQWNRMMIGNYEQVGGRMTDCTVVVSPDSHGGCEKNWVPVFRQGMDTNTQFIYRWWPYEIGEIDASNQLRIHTSVELEDPIFRHTRGSSIFQPCRKLFYETHSTKQKHGDFLVGVVHFSQTNASNAREYYHYLVALDRTTLLPVARSPAFYFFRKSIEFAIGFDVLDTKCRFWVSRMDIDPIMVEVDWRTFRFEDLR